MILKSAAQFALTSMFYSGADVAARGVQFVCLFSLARSCSKEQYGALGLVFALQQLFTMLTLSGLTEVMTGRSAEFRKRDGMGLLFAKSHGLLVKKMSVLLVVGALVAAVTHFVGAMYVSPLAVLFACMSGILLGKSRLIGSMYQLEQRHLNAMQFQTVPLLVCYSVGAACACVWSNPVDGLFIGGGAGLLLWTLFTGTIPFSERTIDLDDPHLERSLLIDSLHFAAIAFLGWLSGYGNCMLVRGIFDIRAVADYTMVLQFDGVIFILLTSIAKVWLPRFYKIAADQPVDRVNLANSLAFQCQSLVVALVGGLILILFPLVPRLLQGNFTEYSHIGPYIAIVFAAQIVLTGYYRSHAYFLLHRKGPLLFRIQLAVSALGFAAWGAVMLSTGTMGIYLGVVIMAAFRSLGTYLYARKQWGLPRCLLDVSSALAILGFAHAMTITSSSMWMQLLAFTAFSTVILIALYFGPIGTKLRVLNRHPTQRVPSPTVRKTGISDTASGLGVELVGRNALR